jgi:hypothetical protein
VLLGSQSRLPLAGPHFPSSEYLAVCFFAVKRRKDRDLDETLEWSLLEIGAHVSCGVHCWPERQRLASIELNLHVGWTHSKLILAAARLANAPSANSVAFILIRCLEAYRKPTIATGFSHSVGAVGRNNEVGWREEGRRIGEKKMVV